MTDIELPYTATFNAIGDAVEQSANGIGISVKAFQEAFQPTLRAIVSQACAAEIESAVNAVLRRLYDWIMAGANDAQTAFTASELRNVAREVECRIHAAREEGRRAGMMEAVTLCNKIALRHQREDGTYPAGKKAGAFECAAAIEAKAKEAHRADV